LPSSKPQEVQWRDQSFVCLQLQRAIANVPSSQESRKSCIITTVVQNVVKRAC
jgi:hypothetical protein